MKFLISSLALGLAFHALAAPPAAQADGKAFDISDKTYREECGGSCHVAYPPQLLPAASWRELMASLDRHFGTDASLESAQSAAIQAYLASQSGRRDLPAAGGKPVLRISETPWFRREHDEVAASVWKRPEVNTAANCAACHRNAEAGDYRERSLRIPK